jgi:hypothetical protein
MDTLIHLFLYALSLAAAPATAVSNLEPPADVVLAQRSAAPEYAQAIDKAVAAVDPDGRHPWWRDELWRICNRESWCGRFGDVQVHEGDSWTGTRAYAGAVSKGLLDPEGCEDHRLDDYGSVVAVVAQDASAARARARASSSDPSRARRYNRRAAKLEALVARLESAPTGDWSARDFATRGAWGQNAARALHRLGRCTPPDALDDPHHAAMAAARTLASCRRWDGPEGDRRRRSCTCPEHTARWVGVGRFPKLPITRRFAAVKRQCGEREAWSYVRRELLGDPGSLLTGWTS